MNGHFWFRALAFVLLLVVVGGFGVAAYNAGIATGVNQVVIQTAQDGGQVVVAPPIYGPYWHGGGFGFFGIFFWIIGIFLFFGLLRAVFGGRRGHRGWGGYGRGPDGGYPGKWGYGGRDDAIADWHRELHRRDESTQADPSADRPSGGA